MSKNQYVSVEIFDLAIEATKNYPHNLKHFQMKRPRLSLPVFWAHLNECLQIDAITEIQAARLVWKLTTRNFKMSNNLLYKLSAVCLMLAQKLLEDETNTLETFSLVSGISMKDLRALELETLNLLDFNLNLSQEQRQLLPISLAQFQF